MMSHVDLERTFSRPVRDETDESYVSYAQYLGGGQHWSDILDAKITVILASAASGKTEEFRQRASALTDGTTTGLFFALEELARQPVDECLTEDEAAALQAWRQGSGEAVFFLDSVDEAKITDPGAFRTALRKLSRFLGDHRARARFVVSCRPSDWNKGVDEAALLEALRPVHVPGVPAGEEVASLTDRERLEMIVAPLLDVERSGSGRHNARSEPQGRSREPNPEVQTWLLNPLDSLQQRKLAEKAGKVEDIDGFMTGIIRHGLEAFAARPGDLLDLAAHWNTHGAFGSRKAMIEAGIDRLLNESKTHRKDGDRLSARDAQSGAQRLAAALVLAKQFTLRAPGAGPAQGIVDPKLVLDDWTDGQREALLRRGLFAPASFGRIRFQHRSSLEFLAARWFETVLQEPGTAEMARKVLFKSVFGTETVTPELRNSGRSRHGFHSRMSKYASGS